MTNEVTLFKNGVPAYLRSEGLNDITKSFLSGNGGKRISIRGGVFRLVVDGKEIATNEERSMNVVVVNAAPKVSRAYYAGAYDASTNTSPTCWSVDGEKPDATSESAQSNNCASCPQNIKGSGQGDSRACRFSRRIAVLLENDFDGDLFSVSLPAQSIFGRGDNGKLPLNAYAQFLAGFNVNITAVVTEMRFDTTSATPKLTFKAIRPLTEEEYAKCTERGQTDEAKAAVRVSYAASPQTPLKQLAGTPAPRTEVEDKASEDTPEPTKRKGKESASAPPKKDLKNILDQWDDEE